MSGSGIRIIAGEARGRMLKTFKDDMSARPMLARIKKSLFDILMPRIPGSRFLDLYAGTGAVGLEALSRGAAWVDFIEMSPKFVGLVRDNLRMLGWEKRAAVHRANVLAGLGWLGARYDVVFMGPPYKDEKKQPLSLTSPTLQAVTAAGLLAPGGVIVSQRQEKEEVVVPDTLTAFRQEKYGDTIVSLYRQD